MTDIISFWAWSRKREKGFWKVFSRMNEQTNERTIFKTENESTEGNKRCQYKWNRWRADTETMKLKDIQNLIIVDIIKLFLSFSGFFVELYANTETILSLSLQWSLTVTTWQVRRLYLNFETPVAVFWKIKIWTEKELRRK
jgi:hypothetical protein